MAKSEEQRIIVKKCLRCGEEDLKREEFSMYGKLGFVGPAYRFEVYICKKCGFSEFFFMGAKWIK